MIILNLYFDFFINYYTKLACWLRDVNEIPA